MISSTMLLAQYFCSGSLLLLWIGLHHPSPGLKLAVVSFDRQSVLQISASAACDSVNLGRVKVRRYRQLVFTIAYFASIGDSGAGAG